MICKICNKEFKYLKFHFRKEHPNAILIRNIDFKTQTRLTIISIIISGIIGIILAKNGFGVWSLVFQQILTSLIITILLWTRKIWIPSFKFSIQSIKDLSGFGLKMLASGLLATVFDNIYLIVIGKLFSPATLGYYTRGNQFQQLPSKTLGRLVSRVVVPTFSSIQDDPERVRAITKKAIKMLAFVNFPIMVGLAAVAKPLVHVLLTEKWLPCVPYLQLLCVVGFFEPLQQINMNILVAFGKSDLYLRLEIVKKILISINVFIGWRFGIDFLIYGQIVIAVLNFYLNSFYNKKLLNYSFLMQLKDLLPYLAISSFMGASVYLFSMINFEHQILLLLCQTAVGFVVYFGICHIFKVSAFSWVKQGIIKKLSLGK